MKSLSANGKSILSAIAGGNTTTSAVATQMGVKVQVVTGSLAGLKKSNYVNVDAGVMSLTREGRKACGITGGETKVFKAATIFKNGVKAKLARKDIVEQFMTELGMSKAGASTYYQNVKKMLAK